MRAYGIAACSFVGALGTTTRESMEAVFAGRSSFGAPAPELSVPFSTAVASMRELPPAFAAFAGYESRLARVACAAAREVEAAVHNACERFSPARIGLVFGTCTGGLATTESAYASLVEGRLTGKPPANYSLERHHMIDAVRSRLAVHFNIGGPSHTVSTACSSSAKAFATAYRWLEADLVDAAVVCGADTLCQTTLFGFHALGALSSTPTRPFARERSGISLGEGAAFVLIERGDAHVALRGVGESSDAHHLSAPDPAGAGAQRAMREALARANMDPRALSHVSAHGTGTTQNDAAEGAAIAALFGPQMAVTATKSLYGHLLGAAGVAAVAIAAESIVRRQIPGTPIGLASPDESIPVRLVTTTEAMVGNAVLVNAFGFGGNNASVLLSA